MRPRHCIQAILLTAALTGGPSLEPSGALAETPREPHLQARRGVSFGLGLQIDRLSTRSPTANGAPGSVLLEKEGGGVFLQAGYAFTPTFSLRVQLAGSTHNTNLPDVRAGHSRITLEAHHQFLPEGSIRPHVCGGLGGAAVFLNEEELDSSISGATVFLGTGFLTQLTRHFAFDLGLRGEWFNWNQVRLERHLPGGEQTVLEDPVEKSGRSGRLHFGLVWIL